MKDLIQHWGLSATVFLPLVGALVMLVIPRTSETLIKLVGLITTMSAFVVGVGVMATFNYDKSSSLQMMVNKTWIPLINSRYMVAVDGISLPLLMLTLFIMPLVVIYSWNHFPEPHNPKGFLILTFVLETGLVGTFLAQDLILFFVCFEVVLLPMYFMIGVWGGENRQYAAIKFFLYTLFGSALMLVSFLAIFFVATGKGGVPLHTFSIPALAQWRGAGLAKTTGLLIFGGMFLGFGIKVPMFPLHTWLPDAHTQAPTQGSVILAALMLKLGTYGFIRVAIPILPSAAIKWAPVIATLAVIGIIYGALGCLAQWDMKRLIAFSSVAHMGFVMLGISTLTTWGINAAVFGMVAHGLITGLLFFIAGSVKERFHTLDMKRLGGMLLQAPRLGWVLGFSVMASLGLPGLAGFWGEFPAILAAYNPAPGLNVSLFRVYVVIAAIGTIFAAAYMLWMLQRIDFGIPKEEWSKTKISDMHVTDYLAWAPMAVLILAFGLYPNAIFHVSDGAVGQTLRLALGGK